MSSIAMIADSNMLEFHRFKGSESVVFWRLSLKRFSKFEPGDLVFFIDRKHRHPQTQEKGIIGFGRCVSIRNKPLHQAWSSYKQELGYYDEASFKEVIRHYRKEEDTLPQRIQCLEIHQVMMLQYPVFLSEVGFDVSERLESFTYLSRGDRDYTHDLLDIAAQMGVDAWYAMHNDRIDSTRFDLVRQEQDLRVQIKQLPHIVSPRDANVLKKHTQGVLYQGIFYAFTADSITLSYANINDIETVFSIYGIHNYLSKVFKNYQIHTKLYLKAQNQSIQHLIQDLNLELVDI